MSTSNLSTSNLLIRLLTLRSSIQQGNYRVLKTRIITLINKSLHRVSNINLINHFIRCELEAKLCKVKWSSLLISTILTRNIGVLVISTPTSSSTTRFQLVKVIPTLIPVISTTTRITWCPHNLTRPFRICWHNLFTSSRNIFIYPFNDHTVIAIVLVHYEVYVVSELWW